MFAKTAFSKMCLTTNRPDFEISNKLLSIPNIIIITTSNEFTILPFLA